MKAWDVSRYAEAPLISGSSLLGFLGVDNPTLTGAERAGDLLLSLAYYVSSMVVGERERRELAESRRRFQRAVDGANLVLWEYDIPARRITMMGNAATARECAAFGWPEVIEDVPVSLVPLVDEDDVPAFLDMFDEVAAGRDATCDIWYKARPGQEPRCERVSYSVTLDDAGSPSKAFGIGQNVTADKKVEERYESEMSFLQENNDYDLVAKGHYNLTQNVVIEFECSDPCLFSVAPGTSYDAMLSAFLALPYPDEDRSRLEDAFDRERLLRRYQRGRMQASVAYPRRLENMPPLWINTLIHTYMSPTTGDIECFTYFYDITAKRRSEIVMDLLAGADVEYVGLIHSHEGAFEFLRKVPRIAWPEVGERASYEACRRHVRDNFVSGDEVAEFEAATSLDGILADLRASGRRVVTYRRTEGDRMLCMQLSYNWFDEESETILVVRTDVTAAYERDQRQLREVEDAKLAADRANEEKSGFLSSMSHDIRTPLNGIIGFADFALEADDLETSRTYVEKVKTSADLLLALVNDVLDLSRIESGKATVKPEATPVESVGMAVVEALRPSAEAKDIHLVAGPFCDKVVFIDSLKYQKIWLNLVSNAIKYTPVGGTVRAFVEPIDPPASGHNRRLVVEDTGIGMSEEFQERMFEPFAQEGRAESAGVQGTGLGLSIVKKIVDLLGGTVRVKSAPGAGTRFEVEVFVQPVEGQLSRSEERAGEADLTGRCVLLCEDNEMNAEIATMILKDRGMLVDWAKNGSEGLEHFEKSPLGYYDAILMDVRMPVMDGRKATRAIRALGRADGRSVPVIALSADAFEEDVQLDLEAGMDAHVTKPFNKKQLLEVLGERMG